MLCTEIFDFLQATNTDEAAPAVELQQEAAVQKEVAVDRAIEQQDNAPQGALLAENLQAGQKAVQFDIFGKTQEAINGERYCPNRGLLQVQALYFAI